MIEKNPFDYDTMAGEFIKLNLQVSEAFKRLDMIPVVGIPYCWGDTYLDDLIRSNDRAADKRRKWHVKPSMVR